MKLCKNIFPVSAVRALLLLSIISIIFLTGSKNNILFPAHTEAAGPKIVTGEISSNTTWALSQSPYLVSGVVILDKGATLTIQPGVIVKFNQNASININGTLIATSTPASPIYFTSSADDKVGGDSNKDKNASVPTPSNSWYMDFINASPSTISNAVIRYSDAGIFALNSSLSIASTSFSQMNGQVSVNQSILNIKNVSFSGMASGALTAYGTSTVMLSSVSVDHSGSDAVAIYNNSILSADHLSVKGETNGTGLEVFNAATASCDQCTFSSILNNNGPSIGVFSASTLSLTNSSIENATGTGATALQVYDGSWDDSGRHSQATISNTVLRGGSANGIMVFGATKVTLANSTVTDFPNDGIQAFGGTDLSVLTSTITKNQNAGVEMWGVVTGSIADSYITGNGQYGFESRTDTPFVAANNWWGSASGPYHSLLNPMGKGNTASDNVIFSPWLKNRSIVVTQKNGGTENSGGTSGGATGGPSSPPCCSNVLFLPGIEASRLYATTTSNNNLLASLGGLLNSPVEEQLWEPQFITDVSQLFLDTSGASTAYIYTKDIINQTNEPVGNFDVYQKFSTMLDSLVATGTIAAWQAYPYDWRLDPQILVENGTQLAGAMSKLEPAIIALAKNSKTGKVTIIAHSNGGVVAKLLLTKLQADGESDLVDKLVLVAVPQLGTPIAIPALLSGYGQSLGEGVFSVLDETDAQELAENMPTAYTLLPSAAYFNKTNPVVTFDPSLNSISNLYKLYGPSINDGTTLFNFLAGTADHRESGQPLLALANKNLLTTAKNLHNTLDTWQAPSGVDVIQIAGIGIDTLSATRYYARTSSPDTSAQIDMAPQTTPLGDGTVVATSAVSDTDASSTYYINLNQYNLVTGQNRAHADILETDPVQELLTTIIKKGSSSSASVVLPSFVSTTISITTQAGEETISVHSPVLLSVYDGVGRHTGPLESATSSSTEFIQNQIPNSYYLPFGEGQYVGIPAATKGVITLSATAVGTFTLDITNNGITTEFSDIPITPVSTASLVLGTTTPVLNVDFDGDGTIDSSFTASTGFDPAAYLTCLKKLITVFGLPSATKNDLKNKIDSIIDKIKKGETIQAKKSIATLMAKSTILQRSVHGIISNNDQQFLAGALNSIFKDM